MQITAYIVDDEAAARERMCYLIEEFLKGQILVKGHATKPEIALEEILALSPQIAFLDVEMPGMSGLELAEKLQAHGFKGQIIFVTAYDQYAIKAIKAKAFDYILKPVDVDELKKTVERFKAEKISRFNTGVAKQYELSEREMELVNWLDQGLSSEEIAEKMYLSKHTIDTHRRNILLKTGVRNSVELLNLLRN